MRHKFRMEDVKFAEIPYPTNIHQAGLADLSKFCERQESAWLTMFLTSIGSSRHRTLV